MLIPNHPHDERLASLASGEADATADATLTAHVTSCDRCTGLIDELGALRAALADLPDVAPTRPLRLLPPVEAAAPASATDRLGGWARRFFAPVLASGAALALVGVVGTAGPSLGGPAASQSGGNDGAATVQEEAADAAPSTAAAGGAPAAAESLRSAAEPLVDNGELSSVTASPIAAFEAPEETSSDRDLETAPTTLSAERSPWPMVLFAGVALMIAALVLRWILVPRVG
jgi:hypothetical protein